jgi:hypothetical protein
MGGVGVSAHLLCALLADPARATEIGAEQWPAILTIAHAERLAGTLAHRLAGLALPSSAQSVLDAARLNAEAGRVQALWEVEMAHRALAPLNVPVVLLKGSAFVAAGLEAGVGRQIGDLDILVPRNRLDDVEAALLAAGWEWVKPDAYDDMYYRKWMHELPPLIHKDRDRMIDVHHTILPLTARPTPDAVAMIADAVALGNGVSILSPADMIIHATAHLFADGELDGGLRNLWDIDRLVREHAAMADFWPTLRSRAAHHQLGPAVARALRLTQALYATPLDFAAGVSLTDRLFIRRMLARNGWGQNTQRPLRFAFTLRGHLLRMPLPMLLRHLWTKWRKRGST